MCNGRLYTIITLNSGIWKTTRLPLDLIMIKPYENNPDNSEQAHTKNHKAIRFFLQLQLSFIIGRSTRVQYVTNFLVGRLLHGLLLGNRALVRMTQALGAQGLVPLLPGDCLLWIYMQGLTSIPAVTHTYTCINTLHRSYILWTLAHIHFPMKSRGVKTPSI